MDNKKNKNNFKSRILSSLINFVQWAAISIFLFSVGLLGSKWYSNYLLDKVSNQEFMEALGMTQKDELILPDRDVPAYPCAIPERLTYPDIIGITELEKLQAIENNDFVFWMYIPGTNVNYYVLQTINNSEYLRNNIYHEYQYAGSLFLDYRNNSKLVNGNNIIYGHNQKNGTMFSALLDYKNPEFFAQNNKIYTYTSEGVTVWEIFSAYETTTENPYTRTYFLSDDDYLEFARGCQEASINSTDIILKKDDTIITLSTCLKDNYSNGRFVVHAVKVGTCPII